MDEAHMSDFILVIICVIWRVVFL